MKDNKEPVYHADIHLFPEFRHETHRSLLALPMVHGSELKGLVFVIHSAPYHFTFEQFKLLQSIIHHSTLAFTNSIMHEELENLVITDHLTRLYSRSHLDETLQASLQEHEEGTFLLFDIDNFKQINDTFGHQVGDSIIIQVAKVMQKNLREKDTAARWGGEELAVYLPNVPLERGIQIAKRIVIAIADETDPAVTASCGVATWHSPSSKSTAQKLFHLADQALYEAKKLGKNQVIAHKDCG